MTLTMERVRTHYPFYTKRGERLKSCLAIMRFKSLSIYYKFTAGLICLTKFLDGVFSSSISIGKPSPKWVIQVNWMAWLLPRDG